MSNEMVHRFSSPREVLVVLGISLLATTGCANRQIKRLMEDLEESRSPDARTGVLAGELSPESRARLELLGRTSAPTRYAERIDANSIRVVAFDFGGVTIGQLADSAGNLMASTCFDVPQNAAEFAKLIKTGPMAIPEAEAVAHDPSSLYKGMFRQYGRQIGTTVEADLAVGPAGGEFKTYFSHNFSYWSGAAIGS